MGLHLFSHRAAGRGRAWSATGARWARAGGAAGANSARAMRASDVVFHSNAIGLTRSLPAPPGTCAGWRALRCGPGRLTRPKVITPAIAAKPAATSPTLQPPPPPPASGPCRVFLGRSVSSLWHVFSSTVWVRFALSGRLKLLSLPTPSPA